MRPRRHNVWFFYFRFVVHGDLVTFSNTYTKRESTWLASNNGEAAGFNRNTRSFNVGGDEAEVGSPHGRVCRTSDRH